MGRIRYRRRPSLGPFRINITESGVRSVALVLGPFTWNLTRRRRTIDLPDGFRYEHEERHP